MITLKKSTMTVDLKKNPVEPQKLGAVVQWYRAEDGMIRRAVRTFCPGAQSQHRHDRPWIVVTPGEDSQSNGDRTWEPDLDAYSEGVVNWEQIEDEAIRSHGITVLSEGVAW